MTVLSNFGPNDLAADVRDTLNTLLAKPSAYLGQVATSGLVPDNINASSLQLMSVTPHIARDEITSLQLVFGNFYVPAPPNSTETALGASSATIEASIEYPAGVYTRVIFSGGNQGTILTKAMIVSDACQVAIPTGAPFKVRTWWSNPNGIVYCSVPSFGNLMSFGTTTPNLVMGGGNPATQTGAGYGPLAIIGQTRRPSVFIAGDSIVAGIGDTPDATLARGIVARSISGLAYINAGVGGDRVQAVVAAGAYTNRLALSAYCSHVVSNFGFNDVVSYNLAPTSVHADLQTFYALFAGKPVWQTTISPKSSGTYNTEAGQTVDADNADRMTFNATLRGGVALIQGVLDTAMVLESTVTPGKWQAPDSSALTSDGVHPNRRGYMKAQSAGIIVPGMFVR